VFRLFRALIAVVLAGCLSLPVVTVIAQTESPAVQGAVAFQAEDPAAAGAAEAARLLSQLEGERDFDALYDLLHPDSRAIAPRAAVVGWYEADLAGRRTAELTVTDVTFIEWTWPVTGVTYPRTASVSFVQPYWTGETRSDVAAAVHLVEDDGEWGWFFGASLAFVDQQIALYAPEIPAPQPELPRPNEQQRALEAERAARFPDPLHAHVDAFWAAEFAAAGIPYDPPDGVIGFDKPMMTACGRADPTTEAAFYCVLDETIYYAVPFRALIEREIGDYGWIVVVAHEWGHHVQRQLGFELGADCLAGAYTKDAEAVGWLDPGDVDEALFMTRISGDPPGTAESDPFAHGSGVERVEAFLEGYDGGLVACQLDLRAASAGGT
jgi:predicted metalloprotease